MVFIGYLLVTSLGVSNMVNGAPLSIGRRNTVDATQAWEQKCLASGEGERCIEVAGKASKALLATAGPCDQQNVADEMIDLAKSLHHNSAELVTLAVEYAHASHATSGSCTTTPKNSELTSSAKSKTVAAKTKTGHSQKSMHKTGISRKEDGEDEEEAPEEGSGDGNQLPGANTPTTPTPNNSTNTTAPTTQPTTNTPINIVVNS
ncbi:hypothetical protein CPB86DRAFT_294077 [Serendipita vermifera]|nr:hypothetical protein CPB86DRAFT_294077 [Serendipita vermifera]